MDEALGMEKLSLEKTASASMEVESEFKLVPRVTISDNTSEVFCVRFSPDGKFLATGKYIFKIETNN